MAVGGGGLSGRQEWSQGLCVFVPDRDNVCKKQEDF